MKKFGKKQISLLIIGIILFIMTIGVIVIYQDQKIPVLCYHNIAPRKERERKTKDKFYTIEEEKFREEMKFLKDNGYQSLTMQEFYEWKTGKKELPRKSVLITFDDGFYSNYQYAFPILKEYGLHATVFLIGRKAIEPEAEANVDATEKYISLDVVRKIEKEYPNIEICSHSFDFHESGKSIEDKDVTEEFLRNDIRKFKEEIHPTKYFAYPRGDHNETFKTALQKEGYDMAFIFGQKDKNGKKHFGKASRKDDNYAIPRLNILNKMSVEKFKYRMLLPF